MSLETSSHTPGLLSEPPLSPGAPTPAPVASTGPDAQPPAPPLGATLRLPDPAPALAAPAPAPAPTAEPAPAPAPAPVAPAPAPVEPLQPVAETKLYRVALHLHGGERVEVDALGDEEAAKARAREVVFDLTRPRADEWPFYGGRFVRPEA